MPGESCSSPIVSAALNGEMDMPGGGFPHHRKLRPQQFYRNLLQGHAPFDHAAQRLSAGDLLEVRISDFQRHGTTARSSTLAVTPDFVDDRQERVARLLEG